MISINFGDLVDNANIHNGLLAVEYVCVVCVCLYVLSCVCVYVYVCVVKVMHVCGCVGVCGCV